MDEIESKRQNFHSLNQHERNVLYRMYKFEELVTESSSKNIDQKSSKLTHHLSEEDINTPILQEKKRNPRQFIRSFSIQSLENNSIDKKLSKLSNVHQIFINYFVNGIKECENWTNFLLSKDPSVLLFIPLEEIANYMNNCFLNSKMNDPLSYLNKLIENFYLLQEKSSFYLYKGIEYYLNKIKRFLIKIEKNRIIIEKENNKSLETFCLLVNSPLKNKNIKKKGNFNSNKHSTVNFQNNQINQSIQSQNSQNIEDFKAKVGMKKCQQYRRYFGYDDYLTPKSITKVFQIIY